MLIGSVSRIPFRTFTAALAPVAIVGLADVPPGAGDRCVDHLAGAAIATNRIVNSFANLLII